MRPTLKPRPRLEFPGIVPSKCWNFALHSAKKQGSSETKPLIQSDFLVLEAMIQRKIGARRMTENEDVTLLLSALTRGDEGAASKLIPIVYGELRRLAASYMRRERVDHTLQPTALVHEAYLKLIEQRSANWQSRSHFLE